MLPRVILAVVVWLVGCGATGDDGNDIDPEATSSTGTQPMPPLATSGTGSSGLGSSAAVSSD
jgi:hypothetical protein